MFRNAQERLSKLNYLSKQWINIHSGKDLDEVLNKLMNEAIRATGADTGSIMLLDEKTNTLLIRCGRGIEPEVLEKTKTKLGKGIAGLVAERGKPELIINGRHEDEYLESMLEREDIGSAIATPLKVKEKVIGVISVNRKKKRKDFTKNELGLIMLTAEQTTPTIENAKLYENLQKTFLGVISSLANAVDAKDHYTASHSERVTKYSIAIAKELDLFEEEIKSLEIAGKLHDIGKIGIDEKILNKPGKLTEEEREIINEHPKIAVKILKRAQSLKDIRPLIHFHHERFDGKGYPAGLADDIIPLGGPPRKPHLLRGTGQAS